jgi:hypothetical protein
MTKSITEQLEALRRVLDESFVIVEHRFYRGSRAPEVKVFYDFEALEAYVLAAKTGDRFCCWRYDELCRDDNMLADGKLPDADGNTPDDGAY